MDEPVGETDYAALHDFRYAIRRFLRFSEDAARAAGIEPQQHQLLLAIKAGHAESVGALAERMQLRHHSAVELIDRVVARGFATRSRGTEDRRQVLVALTAEGEALLLELSLHHLAQLRSQGPDLIRALESIVAAPVAASTTD